MKILFTFSHKARILLVVMLYALITTPSFSQKIQVHQNHMNFDLTDEDGFTFWTVTGVYDVPEDSVFIIPSEIDGHPVKSVDFKAFFGERCIKVLEIPNSVTTIREYAFQYCKNIERLKLSSKLEHLGQEAFSCCSKLSSPIELPATLKGIGGKTFESCYSLKSVSIKSSFTGTNTFIGCRNLTSVDISNNTKSLDGGVFRGCTGLQSLVIPENVTTIGGHAFSDCKSLQQLSFATQAKLSDIKASAFYGCSSLQSIEIPNNVSYIGSNTFESCINLQSVKLPENLEKISSGTFKNCSNLQSIKLPFTIEEIGDNAFSECASLTSVNFPLAINTIGKDAFAYCRNLKSVTLNKGLKVIKEGAFKYTKISSITLPEGLISLSGFEGSTNLQQINIPKSVTEIGDKAFANTGITSVIFPPKLKTIGAKAFKNTQIDKIVIPNTVKYLKEEAFYGCKGIKEINIPDSLYEFWGTSIAGTSITSLTMPNRTMYVSDFSGCDQLVSLVMPDTISSFFPGEGWRLDVKLKFNGCTNLEHLTLPKAVEWYLNAGGKEITNDYVSFEGCNKLKSIEFPEFTHGDWDPEKDDYYIYQNIFDGCTSLSTVVLPKSMTYIEGSFQHCQALKNITLPDSLKVIGKQSFNGCKSLEYLEMPNALKQIESAAFSLCDSLKFIYIPASLETLTSNAFYNENEKLTRKIICLSELDNIDVCFTDKDTLYVPNEHIEELKEKWAGDAYIAPIVKNKHTYVIPKGGSVNIEGSNIPEMLFMANSNPTIAKIKCDSIGIYTIKAIEPGLTKIEFKLKQRGYSVANNKVYVIDSIPSAILINEGDTEKIHLSDNYESEVLPLIVFENSNDDVAIVDEMGNITAKSNGETDISIKLKETGDTIGVCKVVVNMIPTGLQYNQYNNQYKRDKVFHIDGTYNNHKELTPGIYIINRKKVIVK